MRHILITAAGLAACGLLASTAVQAQTYEPGGPTRIGNMCKVMTDDQPGDESYGYYTPCADQALAEEPPPPRRVRPFRGYR